MTATTTPLAELMSIVDELRRLDDEELIAAWRTNEAAIAQAGRLGGDDQARFRHYVRLPTGSPRALRPRPPAAPPSRRQR